MLYKTVDGILVIIQVNRQKRGNKTVLKSALKTVFDQLKLTEDQIKRVKIVPVPHPALGLKQIMELKCTEEMDFLTAYDVWQIPLKYTAEI
jgi:hypothetical protein